MKKNNDKMLLKMILEYCNDIESSLDSDTDMKEYFFKNAIYRHGCSMCILQIGELSKRLSNEFKETEPNIPWREWAGIRDFFAHKYYESDFDIIWDTIEDDIPALKEVCERNIK